MDRILRAIALSAFLSIGVAFPIEGQEAAALQKPFTFPGLPWGAPAATVLSTWGEPVVQRQISRGLTEFDYLDVFRGVDVLRYFVVHPELGMIIAGVAIGFEEPHECERALAHAIELVRQTIQNADVREAESSALCSEPSQRFSFEWHDEATDTRLSIRAGPNRERLAVDAISSEGFRWLGRSQ